MWARRILLGLIIIIVVGAIGFTVLAWHSAIDPITPPDRTAFDPATIARGAQLAAIGNCNICHTKEGGESFAGGFPLPTPFGTIYGTNITPDPETGIGQWSQEAFRRAMREGIDREGRHLYPAFPYTNFTKMTDADIDAIYAYLMTRQPVRSEMPENDLPFPLNFRPILAGWNLLFHDEGVYQPDRQKDEAWNHGAYLAEGAGHCSACHTPRNRLGAEQEDAAYNGGIAEGWYAPALNDRAVAPAPWTTDSLFAYLHDGFDKLHGAAAGPMAPIVRNLAQAPKEDVLAIAVYISSLSRKPEDEREKTAKQLLAQVEKGGAASLTASDATPPDHRGAAIYAGACASCHEGTGISAQGLPLSLSASVAAPEPRNLIHIIRDGIHPPEGAAGPFMPGYAGTLTDDQIAELVTYLRSRFSTQPAWRNVEGQVAEVSNGHHTP